MSDRHLPRLTCQQNGQLSPPPKFSQFPDRSQKLEGQGAFSQYWTRSVGTRRGASGNGGGGGGHASGTASVPAEPGGG